MGKHINGLYGFDAVLHIQQLQVTGLCSGITADIDNALGLCFQNNVDDVGMHACAGWVSDDDIGPSVLADKILCQDIFHVAGKEECIVDAVDF